MNLDEEDSEDEYEKYQRQKLENNDNNNNVIKKHKKKKKKKNKKLRSKSVMIDTKNVDISDDDDDSDDNDNNNESDDDIEGELSDQEDDSESGDNAKNVGINVANGTRDSESDNDNEKIEQIKSPGSLDKRSSLVENSTTQEINSDSNEAKDKMKSEVLFKNGKFIKKDDLTESEDDNFEPRGPKLDPNLLNIKHNNNNTRDSMISNQSELINMSDSDDDLNDNELDNNKKIKKVRFSITKKNDNKSNVNELLSIDNHKNKKKERSSSVPPKPKKSILTNTKGNNDETKNDKDNLINDFKKLKKMMNNICDKWDKDKSNMKTREMYELHSEILSFNKKQKYFKERVDGMCEYITCVYTTWNIHEMIEWISYLENGRFKKYCDILKEGFKEDGITKGDMLPKLNASDLSVKPFNIRNFSDRKDLERHFSKLKDSL